MFNFFFNLAIYHPPQQWIIAPKFRHLKTQYYRKYLDFSIQTEKKNSALHAIVFDMIRLSIC